MSSEPPHDSPSNAAEPAPAPSPLHEDAPRESDDVVADLSDRIAELDAIAWNLPSRPSKPRGRHFWRDAEALG
jgi:hypothetical protein